MNLDTLIRALSLQPHPEGGWYAETYRADLEIRALGREMSASTAIYYLLKAGDFSAFHRIRSDEMWHHYAGGGVTIHTLTPGGGRESIRLGLDFEAGELPQAVVPAGVWFAAEPAEGSDFALCGCTVAPGFEFRDFELADPDALAAQFPDAAGLIRRLTREPPA